MVKISFNRCYVSIWKAEPTISVDKEQIKGALRFAKIHGLAHILRNNNSTKNKNYASYFYYSFYKYLLATYFLIGAMSDIGNTK